MSVVLSVMFLAYLFGIQATDMGHQQAPPTQDTINSLIIQLLQADLTRDRGRTGEAGVRQSRNREDQNSLSHVSLPTIRTSLDNNNFLEQQSSLFQPMAGLSSDLLQQQKRFNSPRVLLSERPPLQPPPLYLIDDYVKSSEAANKTRRKRYAEHKSYRGEYSVCDSESNWVIDKTNAVDLNGRQVTVLSKIKSATDSSFVKQYFYETKCRTDMPVKSSCRGIDDKHWNSQCKTSQTYVRALTQDRNTVGWRWIRIDTSCVCALSRKRPARRKVT